jgi:hypothetical protein
MPVTDDQVATLRAYLAGDFDTHKRLFGQLDRASARVSYPALVTAAFCEAVERRFTKSGTPSDVIEFVGEVRSRHLKNPDEIESRVAERVILAIFTDEEVSDLDAEIKFRTQFILLLPLIDDEQFDPAGLDMFLGKARKLADQWIA